MKKTLLNLVVFALLWTSLTVGSGTGYDPEIQSRLLLKTSVNHLGKPIHYLKTGKPEVTALEVEIPPGKETGWHMHPVPAYAYILSGTLTLEIKGQKDFQLDSGQAYIEVVDIWHNGKNLGTKPVKIVVFYTGEAGKPNTVKENGG